MSPMVTDRLEDDETSRFAMILKRSTFQDQGTHAYCHVKIMVGTVENRCKALVFLQISVKLNSPNLTKGKDRSNVVRIGE